MLKVVTGILVIGIACVWFVAGLANGIVYLYPPLLGVLGAVRVGQGFHDMSADAWLRRSRELAKDERQDDQ